MDYWIITIPSYDTFVFYGLECEAFDDTEQKSKWYNSKGKFKKADKNDPNDVAMVRAEITNSQLDRKTQPGIPYMSRDGWF